MYKIRLRHVVIDSALHLCRLGLGKRNQVSGSLSRRIDENDFIVTPRGVAPMDLKPFDLVRMNLEGDVIDEEETEPSPEWRLHRDILKARPNLNAAIVIHAPFATTLACLQKSIPAFHYMVAYAGGDEMPCAPYATFGTQEQSDNVLATLGQTRACLLARHGLVTVGETLDEATTLAAEVEVLAETYWRALSIEDPGTLGSEEMERVRKVIDTLRR